jgi:hypothetical protein
MSNSDLYGQDSDLQLVTFLLPYLQHQYFVDIAAELGFSNFVAVRRVHGTPGESLDLNPTELGANDWGNLVFFRSDFWEKIEAPLKDFLQNWVPPAIESAPQEEPPVVSDTPAVQGSSPTSAPAVPLFWWEKLLGRK